MNLVSVTLRHYNTVVKLGENGAHIRDELKKHGGKLAKDLKPGDEHEVRRCGFTSEVDPRVESACVSTS